MGCIALVSFAAGIGFLLIGAWPVFGFFGLDVVLIWWALKRNFRDGKAQGDHHHQQSRGEPGEGTGLANRTWRLTLSAAGPASSWKTMLKRDLIGRLFLVSKGVRTEIGSFLSPDDRKSLCSALNGFLAPAHI
jgi:uncharacterized membrane protein